jgi:DNA repair exonuclease SbcCD ATPase subunit
MLDAKVIEAVKSLGKQSDDMARQITQIKKRINGNRDGYEAELTNLKSQIAENEKDIKVLVVSLGKSEGSNAEKYIIEQIDELHEKGEALKKRLSELEAVMKQHDLADIEFDIIRQTLASMGESIDQYSVEQKRAAIRTFIRKIVWDGENAHLYLFHNEEDRDFPAPPDKNTENTLNIDQQFCRNSEDSGEPLGEDSE